MSDYKYVTYQPQLFQLIEPNKKVLDVGCATGLLGEKLKQEKNCYVMGIEVDESAARKATKVCNGVITADIEELKEIPFPSNHFDIIVLGDVLEHLKAPEKVLRMLKKYLSNEGYVLISVPNVGHWRVRLKLLFGKFNYTSYGTLDEGHLRFFTQKTLRQTVEQCGYEIKLFEGFGFSWSNIWKGLLASAFIVKAVKSNKPDIKSQETLA